MQAACKQGTRKGVLDPLLEDALWLFQGVTSRYFAGKASELVASRMKEWNERRTQEFRSLLQEDAESRPAHGRPPRCIVLAPTRELAKQVEAEFKSAAPGLRLGCFYGGTNIGEQIRELRGGVDVVVGTPGRIMDLMDRAVLNLMQVCGCPLQPIFVCAAPILYNAFSLDLHSDRCKTMRKKASMFTQYLVLS